MAERYTAQEDIIGTKADGRTYLILKKGQSMPMERAKELGLVKEPKTAKPSETKRK